MQAAAPAADAVTPVIITPTHVTTTIIVSTIVHHDRVTMSWGQALLPETSAAFIHAEGCWWCPKTNPLDVQLGPGGMAPQHVWREQAVRGHPQPLPCGAAGLQGHRCQCLLSRSALRQAPCFVQQAWPRCLDPVTGNALGTVGVMVCFAWTRRSFLEVTLGHADLTVAATTLLPAGYVATDMSSWRGYKHSSEGADTPSWLALLAPTGTTGKFFSSRQEESF